MILTRFKHQERVLTIWRLKKAQNHQEQVCVLGVLGEMDEDLKIQPKHDFKWMKSKDVTSLRCLTTNQVKNTYILEDLG